MQANTDDENAPREHVLSPQEDDEPMENLVLSPMSHGSEDHDDDVEHSASRLIPLAMTDASSSSSSRPLPSLNAPFTYRDVHFVGIYIFHVLLMLLATSYIRADVPDDEQDRVNGVVKTDTDEQLDLVDETVQEMNASAIAIQLRSLCVVNVLFSFGWLLIYLFNSKTRFIQGSCAFSIIGLSIFAFVLFAVENNGAALFVALLATATAVFDIVWIKRTKNGFDFVAVLFELIVDFLVKHPSLAYVTIGTLVAYTLWACWICTSLGFVGNGASPWQFSMLFLYLHFYWTSNIFKNILTFVVSGATIIWYYKDDSSDLSPQTLSDHPDSPSDEVESEYAHDSASIYPWKRTMERKVVLHYVRGALTSSFGSICIGSLLCPLAHVFWNVVRWARRDESVLSRRFVSLRSETVEHFIRTYHKYSFVHVAGYGKPFYVAANDSWKFIESQGVEAIVDDDLTSRLLLLGANGWASIMSALCVPAFSNTHHVVFFTVASFVLCYTTISIAMQVMAAVIKTLFVCFAENPNRLSQLHPLIYHRFARLAELKSFRDHKAPPSFGRHAF